MKTTVIFFTVLVICAFASCVKEKAKPSGLSDENMFAYANDTSGGVYYKNGNELSGAGGSPHGNFKLRFNPKAAAVLNADLELPVSSVFPDSSLLVKEVISGGNLVLYVLMFKHKGTWLWAEYGPGGNIVHGIGEGAAVCLSCHNQSPNRDKTLTFDLH